MRLNLEGFFQAAVTQHLKTTFQISNHTPFQKLLGSNLRLIKLGETLKVYDGEFSSWKMVETSFWDSSIEGGLSAFKTSAVPRTGAGLLPLVSPGGCLAMPRARPTANSFFSFFVGKFSSHSSFPLRQSSESCDQSAPAIHAMWPSRH